MLLDFFIIVVCYFQLNAALLLLVTIIIYIIKPKIMYTIYKVTLLLMHFISFFCTGSSYMNTLKIMKVLTVLGALATVFILFMRSDETEAATGPLVTHEVSRTSFVGDHLN